MRRANRPLCWVAVCVLVSGSSGCMAGEIIPEARIHRASTKPLFEPTFSPDIYLSHIYFLASDEMGGRGVGSPGIARAAQYIADQFAEAGLEPGGEEGTYFHRVDIGMGVETTNRTELVINDPRRIKLEIDQDYRPFAFSSSDPFEGELAFVAMGWSTQTNPTTTTRGSTSPARWC